MLAHIEALPIARTSKQNKEEVEEEEEEICTDSNFSNMNKLELFLSRAVYQNQPGLYHGFLTMRKGVFAI